MIAKKKKKNFKGAALLNSLLSMGREFHVQTKHTDVGCASIKKKMKKLILMTKGVY